MSFFYLGLGVLITILAVSYIYPTINNIQWQLAEARSIIKKKKKEGRDEKYYRLIERHGLTRKPIVYVDWTLIKRNSCWDSDHIWVVEHTISIEPPETLTIAAGTIVIFKDLSREHCPGTLPYFPRLVPYRSVNDTVGVVTVDQGAKLMSDNGDLLNENDVCGPRNGG